MTETRGRKRRAAPLLIGVLAISGAFLTAAAVRRGTSFSPAGSPEAGLALKPLRPAVPKEVEPSPRHAGNLHPTAVDFQVQFQRLWDQPQNPRNWLALGIPVLLFDDVAEVLSNFDPLNGEEFPALWQTVFAEWARKAPQAAAAWAVSARTLAGRRCIRVKGNPVVLLRQLVEPAAAMIAREWAKQDFAAALEWMIAWDAPRVGQIGGRALSSILRSVWSASELEEALEIGRHDPTIETIVDRILDRALSGMKCDPASAVDLARSLDRKDRVGRLGEAVERWAQSDPAEAAAWVEKLEAGEERDRCRLAVAGGVAAVAPGVAVAWIAAWSPGEHRSQAMARIGAAWATKDPESAMAWAKSLSAKAERELALTSAVYGWASSAPREAATWLAIPGEEGRRSKFLATVLESWATVDLDAMTAWAREQVSGDELLTPVWIRGQGCQQSLASLIEKDQSRLMRLLESLTPGEERNRTREAALHEWACSDRNAALDWAWSREEVNDRTSCLRTIGRAWADQDPEAALAWAKGMDNPGVLHAVKSAATESVFRQDPEAALKLAQEPDRDGENSNLYGLLGGWAESDLAAATRWAEGVSDPKARDIAFRHLVYPLARKDSAVAIVWAEGLKSAEDRESALRQIAFALADEHPTKALRIAQTLGVGDERLDDVFFNIAHSWTRMDPQSAVRWASGLTGENRRRYVLGNAADVWAKLDPVAAQAWAAGEPDPKVREIVQNASRDYLPRPQDESR